MELNRSSWTRGGWRAGYDKPEIAALTCLTRKRTRQWHAALALIGQVPEQHPPAASGVWMGFS